MAVAVSRLVLCVYRATAHGLSIDRDGRGSDQQVAKLAARTYTTIPWRVRVQTTVEW